MGGGGGGTEALLLRAGVPHANLIIARKCVCLGGGGVNKLVGLDRGLKYLCMERR